MTSLLDLMGDKGQAPREPISAAPADARKTEHVELDLVLHYDNEVKGELLVSLDGHEGQAVWLSKSHIQSATTERLHEAWTGNGAMLAKQLPVIVVNCPLWLAQEKGLI